MDDKKTFKLDHVDSSLSSRKSDGLTLNFSRFNLKSLEHKSSKLIKIDEIF
jgi:hypothetical protein